MKCDAAVRVKVDVTNPGQFFAACGLLELADRLWGGAEGMFENGTFCFAPLGQHLSTEPFSTLIRSIRDATLNQVDPEDDYASPLTLGSPFDLRIDWWRDTLAGSNALKVWAGSMQCTRIARAMQKAIALPNNGGGSDLFAVGEVVYDPSDRGKKVEPFYFDARRGSTARSLDIGFSPDALQLTTLSYPAVEFLCLIGLQRFRPKPAGSRRLFEFHTWNVPLTPQVAPLAVCGFLAGTDTHAYRFKSVFRTDQRKHKAFGSAVPIEEIK